MSKARDLADLAKNANDRLDTVATSDGALSNRNLIINGDMRVAQRGASVTGITNGDTGCHTVDRFRFMEGSSPTYVLNVLQSGDAPNGFANSFKYVVTTAQPSLGSTDQMGMDYSIEGQDLQHLKWGTSDAKPLSLSFWAKSNVVATYVVWFYSWDTARAITKTYTINAANTWEYKTITIPGDTAAAFDNDNNKSLLIRWVLAGGTGTTSGTASDVWRADNTTERNVGLTANMASAVNNEFLLTGVQLEVGSKSTDFEHIPYADQLRRCQRYFQRFGALSGNTINGICNLNVRSTTAKYAVVHHPVVPRAQPTVGFSSYSDFILYAGSSSTTPTGFAYQGTTTSGSTEVQITTGSFGSAGWGGWLRLNSTTGYLDFDMELI